VEPEQLRQCFEAARWAASSYNEQPWRFILATQDNASAYEKMLGCLVEANRAWAKQAPVLMLTATRTTFSKNDKPNRVHQHDLGAAMLSLSLQATDLGLYVHQMAGVDLDKVRETYGIPDDFQPQTAAAIGYGGEPGSLPEDWMREAENAPRTRKDLGEILFAGRFGDAASVGM
jgi:nitroreductase